MSDAMELAKSEAHPVRQLTQDDSQRFEAQLLSESADPPRISINGRGQMVWIADDHPVLALCLGMRMSASRQQILSGLREIERALAFYDEGIFQLPEGGGKTDEELAVFRSFRRDGINLVIADLWNDPPRSRAEFQARLLVNEVLALARSMVEMAFKGRAIRYHDEGGGGAKVAATAAKVAQRAVAMQGVMQRQPTSSLAVNIKGNAIVQGSATYQNDDVSRSRAGTG